MQTVSGYSNLLREDILDDVFYHSTDDIPLYVRMGDGQAKAISHEWRARVRRARALNQLTEGEEWSVSGDPTHPNGTAITNATQIHSTRVRISESARAVGMVGIIDIFAEESQNALETLGTDIEYSLWRGAIDTGDPREMAGVIDRTHFGSGGSYSATIRMNELDALAAGAGLTRALVRAAQLACYNDGEKPDTMFVNPTTKFDCAEFTSTQTVLNREESARVHYDGVDFYDGDLGRLEIIITRDLLDSEAYLCRMSLLRKAWLRRVLWRKLADTGDSSRGWWICELTLENKKMWSTTLIHNINR